MDTPKVFGNMYQLYTTQNTKGSYIQLQPRMIIESDKPCSYCGIIDYKHNQCQRCGAPK